MSDNTLRISVKLPTSINLAWKAIVDWERQGDWMLQTKVWVTSNNREGVDTAISAFTGPFYKRYPTLSKFGLLDTMVVTKWEPPFLCEVMHTGRVFKGAGSFELVEISQAQTLFNWSETIETSRIKFLLIAPFLWLGVRISLARLSTTLR